jgi:hypothetical protein
VLDAKYVYQTALLYSYVFADKKSVNHGIHAIAEASPCGR